MVIEFFVVPIIPMVTKSGYALSPYFAYIHVILSYLVITSIIAIEWNSLREFYIDRTTLWLLIISCFVRTRLGFVNEMSYLLPIMLLGLVNFLLVMRYRLGIPQTDKKAILQSIVLASIALAIVTIVESFQADNWITPIYSANIVLNLVRQLIFQLSFVILLEEIVFRGLLTGYLIRIGFKETTAFTIQAILFWLTHYARAGNLTTFLFSIPVLTLFSTLAVQRFKQLFPAIIIHTFTNVLMSLLINLWF